MDRSFSTSSLNKIFSCIRPHQLTSSPAVDKQLSKIITLLLRDFVSNWFSAISSDEEIYSEVIRIVSQLLMELEHRLSKVDWIDLLSQDIPQILKTHVKDIRSCSEKVGTAYAGGKNLEQLFFGAQPHIALEGSTQSEIEYLRRVADILIDNLMPTQESQSDAVRFLTREVLTNSVFAYLADTLSEPAYLNELLLHVRVSASLLFNC